MVDQIFSILVGILAGIGIGLILFNLYDIIDIIKIYKKFKKKGG